jgi:hypothetical protein
METSPSSRVRRPFPGKEYPVTAVDRRAIAPGSAGKIQRTGASGGDRVAAPGAAPAPVRYPEIDQAFQPLQAVGLRLS